MVTANKSRDWLYVEDHAKALTPCGIKMVRLAEHLQYRRT